jgi:peptidyl-prolyl cis-trans isomerase SurA
MMRIQFGAARATASTRFCGQLALASVVLTGFASGQMRAPRYQSPINAPTQQVILPPPPAISPNGTVVEDVIVRVNDQIIDRSDLTRGEQQIEEEGRGTNLPPAEVMQRQKDLLRDMIDQQLLQSRAKELGYNVDTLVIRQLDEIRKKNNMDTMEDLEKAVRQSGGASFEDFKANIRNSLLTQKVVQEEVSRHMQMTPREEQAYYDAHKQEFVQPEQVRMSEILVPLPADASETQVAQAQITANDIEAKIKAGTAFDVLAKQYSGGQTASKGGDLGFFKRGVLAKVLEDKTFSLKPGESTDPIRTRQGFVVLKVTDRQEAGVPPLAAVEGQIQEAMYHDAIQPALRQYLTKLREDAYIDIAPGYVDTGASPKETKPVFSAYAPPAPKKKTEEKKQRLVQSATTTLAGAKPAAGGIAPAGSGTATPGAALSGTTGAAVSQSTAAGGKGRVSNVSTTTKRKKLKREKIRYGQAPRNSLPTSPQETATVGGGVGPGAAVGGVLPAPGTAIAPIDQTTTTMASNADPLAPVAPNNGKTRFSERQKTEAETKAAAKVVKAKEVLAKTPAPLPATEKATAQTQDAPLGLNGDTSANAKKKKAKAAAKGGPKERLQDQAPAPAAAKPDATPIPPKAVRDNGEPAVTPIAPANPAGQTSDHTVLPPANAPAPGAPADGAPTSPTVPPPPGSTPQ